MKRVVLDASVIIKWVLPERDSEADTDKALMLLEDIRADRLEVLQAPHWLAEVAAVLARLSPSTALEDIANLHDLRFAVESGAELYFRATELAIQLDHHLFDTLYHACAQGRSDTWLITADARYYRRAADLGFIMLLSDWPGAGRQ